MTATEAHAVLADLRTKLDGVDSSIERTRVEKREATEAVRRITGALDEHIVWLRAERAKLVAAIKVASKRARGVRSRS